MKWNSALIHLFRRQKKWVGNISVLNNAKRNYAGNNVEKKFLLKEEEKQNKKTQKGYVPSLDEALYLSKELGIKTTTEIQRIIMRSPPFSPDTSPFVIENFFRNESTSKRDKNAEALSNTEKEIELLQTETDEMNGSEQDDEMQSLEDSSSNSNYSNAAHYKNRDIVSKILMDRFNKNKTKTFVHDEKEWLEESEGIGTNKRSCAYAYIKRGSGIVKINNEEDLFIRWPYFYNRIDVIEPFHLTNTACVYDVFLVLKGGGVSGQARAARLAIGRALLNACPLVQDILETHDILYEDVRQKLPKMPGRRKARAMKQWSKR